MNNQIIKELQDLEKTKKILELELHKKYQTIGAPLEENPVVGEYIRYKKEEAKLLSSIASIEDNQRIIIVNNCDDPILIYLGSQTDAGEGRAYWHCYCLECGKFIDIRAYDGKNKRIIKSPLSVHEIINIYNQLKSTYEYELNYDKIYIELQERLKSNESKVKIIQK